MRCIAIPVQSILGRGGVSPAWTVCAALPVLMILLPGLAVGQMVEERDGDDPPVEQPSGAPEETRPDLSVAEQTVIDRTNEFRKQQELQPVTPSPKLNETAQYFADFMARTGKYGHTADGKRPSQRATEHGYESCIVSENIAYQFSSTGFTADQLAGKFFTGWKNSPEHRKNMLDPDVTETGLAIAREGDSPTYFAVQMFGRPQSESIEFQVRNESEVEVEYTLSRSGSENTFPLPPRLARTHQRCRPSEIEFSEPDTTLKIESGAKYLVTQSSDGKLEVKRQ